MSISKSNLATQFSGLILLSSIVTSASAQLPTYFEDFEGAQVDKTYGLSVLQWKNFGTVYAVEADGTTIATTVDTNGETQRVTTNQYGPNGAINSSAVALDQFSAIACGEADTEQGVQYLNVFSDYQNYLDRTEPNPTNSYIESLTMREYVISADDSGKRFTLQFDAKRPKVPDTIVLNPCNSPKEGDGITDTAAGIASTSTDEDTGVVTQIPGGTAGAFIKILNPSDDYALVDIIEIDTTDIARDSWTTMSIDIDITADHGAAGNFVLQLGFMALEQNYGNTGVYYDNISFSGVVIEEETSFRVPFPFAGLGILAMTLAGIFHCRSKIS